MEIQVFYFTRTNRSETIAKKIAEKYNADVFKISEEEEYKGALGFIKGGAKSAKKETANISYEKPSVDKTIVLVFPIWAGGFPPAINTFILQNKKENIILIPTSLISILKDRQGFKKVIDLVGKEINDIKIDLE